ATADLVPADRKRYALRDVSGTVPSIPLICASIMSKKLAENLDALVLDVKWGSGAFMRKQNDARTLAQAMVDTGVKMGVKTTALLTDMNQPHGRMCGNTVEVEESLDILRGEGPVDASDLSIALAAELLVQTGVDKTHDEAIKRLNGLIASGHAMEKFREMVTAQGGDLDKLVPAAPAVALPANRVGYVTAMNCEQLGMALIEMGGGRKKLGDKVDHSIGLELLVRLGDPVERDQPIANVYCPSSKSSAGIQMIMEAITIG